MVRMTEARRKIFLPFVLLMLVFLIPSLGFGQEEKKDTRPERAISVYPEYSGVIVTKNEAVRMDLVMDNGGRKDESVDVTISQVPKGWKAMMKGGNYQVTGMFVPNGKSRTLALTLEPDKTVGNGTYVFQIDSQTADKKIASTQKLTVTVQERTTGADDIQITTSYPVLRTQTDSRVEFSLEILNKSENDRNFNLVAVGPEKWEINFKPAYEAKQISSLRIKGGQSQTVAVEVSPNREAASGEYPVQVRISAGDKKAEVKLTVILTGIYRIDAGTPTGVLSLEAMRGKTSNFSVFVKNTGSAINRNITFSSFKPENWEVTFKPEKIESLDPNAMKQIEVTVKPAPQALVGDYSVGVLVNGEKSDKTIEMRVTVRASTTWIWVGIIAILCVIGGLALLFIKLGRR
jgi:uncharacterized membrane protein